MAGSIVKQNPVLNQAYTLAKENNGPLGPDLAGSILENWLYPGVEQEREFGQQIALQEAQNQYNSEQERMRRMKEAGINPALAASGISGAGAAPSTSSPNSAVGAGASLPAAVGSLAENANAALGAYEKLSLTPVEKEKRQAETVASLEAAGLSHWEALAVATLLPDRQKNLQADTYLKIANFRNTCEEYHNIVLEHDRRKSEIDLIEKQAYQAEKAGNLAEAERLKVEAQTRGIEFDNWWKETDRGFWESHGYRQDDSMDVALRNAVANGKTEAAEVIGDAIENYNYRTETGIKRSDVENAYKEAFEEAKGNADVAAMFKEFNVDVDTWAKIFVDMWSSSLENPDDIKGAVAKFLNQMMTLLPQLQVSTHQKGSPSGNRVGSHDKPVVGGKYVK